MLRISRSDLEAYRSTLIDLGRNAAAYVGEVIESESGSVASMREYATDAIIDALDLYGESAQALASQLFDEICAAEGISAEAEIFDGIIDQEMMARKISYFSRKLVERDTAGFASDCGALADFYVKRSAYENTLRNCYNYHVRYARVPTGPTTCDWCTMLASRGFVYYTSDTAYEGSHMNCDCVVVPGGPDTTVEGYDPDAYYKAWRESGFMPPKHNLKGRMIESNLAGREPDWEYIRKYNRRKGR